MTEELKARKSATIEAGKPNVKNAIMAVGCLMTPFLLLLLLVLVLGFGTTFYNDSRLRRLERDFAAIPHLPGSKFVVRAKEVGLFANGNHCDFLVAEVRSFTGSKNAVRNFYKPTRVAVPNSADDGYSDVKNGTQPVEVQFLASPLPANYRWKYGYAEGINLSAFRGQKNLYVILIGNSGESNSLESLCDWRCL